ncbi:MAG: mechanosensitive ion channel [Saprospiraceae bacterium]|nr:mechanosensitive ion channel [Saprospiraceae bacterium]
MTELQWIETGITLMTYILARFIIHRSIDTMVANQQATKTRSKVVKKAINFTLLLVVTAILTSIFGVDQSELVVFISSVFTILGIALFAQWSILSNITAGVIIFFNHTVSLDDTISIIDKDYEVEGRISDIGLMFVVLKTKENEQISIPNNVFIQKMVKNKK